MNRNFIKFRKIDLNSWEGFLGSGKTPDPSTCYIITENGSSNIVLFKYMAGAQFSSDAEIEEKAKNWTINGGDIN